MTHVNSLDSFATAATECRNIDSDDDHDDEVSAPWTKEVEELCANRSFANALQLIWNVRQDVSIAGATELRLLLGSVYRLKGESSTDEDGAQAICCFERAVRELRLALRDCAHCNDIRLESRCLHEVAKVHLRLGIATGDDNLFDKAYSEAARSLDLSQRNGLTNDVSRNLQLLDQIDRLQG